MDKLKPFHKDFVREYIACGYIGQRAYLKLKPYVKPKTAQVEASKLLSLPIVKEELQRLSERRECSSLASREGLIQEAHRIGGKAEEEGAFGAALKGVELKAKLNRLFERDTPDMAGYQTLMQQLIINVSPAPEPFGEVIEVKKASED